MTNVLITGGAGFIAHHVIDYLLRNTNYNIVSLDRLDSSGTLIRVSEVLDSHDAETRKRLRIVWHDLRSALNDIVTHKIGDINIILHLAAGSHVDRSISNPMEFVLDNVVGTTNILDFARLHCPNLEKFIYFSTDEVFGPAPQGVFYKEDDRYNSGNPYAASKAGGEEMAMAYANTYGMPIVVSHTMNVFGIRQHPEKFIPLVIKSCLLDQQVLIHSDSSCTKAGSRCYINTEDVADAVQFLITHGEAKQKYNVVGKEEIDNLTLAQTIADIMGKPLNYKMVDFHSSRPGHDLRYALDGTKMRLMGWEPKKNVRERLEEVVAWTLSNKKWLLLK